MFTSSIKREVRHFHVVVVQKRNFSWLRPDTKIREEGPSQKTFFRSFGPQFGLKIRGGAPRAPPLDPPLFPPRESSLMYRSEVRRRYSVILLPQRLMFLKFKSRQRRKVINGMLDWKTAHILRNSWRFAPRKTDFEKKTVSFYAVYSKANMSRFRFYLKSVLC